MEIGKKETINWNIFNKLKQHTGSSKNQPVVGVGKEVITTKQSIVAWQDIQYEC